MGYRTTKSKIEVESNKTDNYTDFFYHTFRNVLIIGIPLVIISATILSSLHISATDSTSSTDTLSFSISSSCTLSSVVDRNHNAELINGTYVDGIGQTTIATLCNDGNGYSIYANGYSNNEEGNNKLVNTENSNFNIISGTAQSGTTSNWAMSLNNLKDDPSLTPPTIENAYNNTYGIVPNEWTKVASLPARATDMIKGSSFTTTYAVYTSSSQYAGTYNGQVKYMLVHPSYKPAVYFMQDVASWKNLIDTDESIQAIDKRDGKSYWVTKLRDGNVWMTQNLDLDIGGTGVAALTSENTDISTTASGSGIYANGYTESNGVWTWAPISTAITANTTITYPNNTNNPTVSPAWPTDNNGNTKPYSAEGGDTYYYTSNSTSNDTRYTSLKACTDANHTETECKHYHAGNYYNWTAAIASNNSSNLTTQYANAPSSICPKGWRLPIATDANQSIYEFGELLFKQGIITTKTSTSYTTDGFNNIRKAPLWLARVGRIYSTSLGFSTTDGYYWYATAVSNNAYHLAFNNSEAQPANEGAKSAGRSIRCLAR